MHAQSRLCYAPLDRQAPQPPHRRFRIAGRESYSYFSMSDQRNQGRQGRVRGGERHNRRTLVEAEVKAWYEFIVWGEQVASARLARCAIWRQKVSRSSGDPVADSRCLRSSENTVATGRFTHGFGGIFQTEKRGRARKTHQDLRVGSQRAPRQDLMATLSSRPKRSRYRINVSRCRQPPGVQSEVQILVGQPRDHHTRTLSTPELQCRPQARRVGVPGETASTLLNPREEIV